MFSFILNILYNIDTSIYTGAKGEILKKWMTKKITNVPVIFMVYNVNI